MNASAPEITFLSLDASAIDANLFSPSAKVFRNCFSSAVITVTEEKMPNEKTLQEPEPENISKVKIEPPDTRAIFPKEAKNQKTDQANGKINNANGSDGLSYKGQDLMELARNTISCLGHISENYYFGITILICVLRGGMNKQIVKHKLNEVPEYGIYANMSRDDMRAVVQWMINNHFMLKTKAKYPVLHPTYDGIHFDKCITKRQIKDLKKYLDDPNREIFDDEDSEA